jgi:hypothetical protein
VIRVRHVPRAVQERAPHGLGGEVDGARRVVPRRGEVVPLEDVEHLHDAMPPELGGGMEMIS